MREDGVKWTCTRCGKTEFHPHHILRSKYPDENSGEWAILGNDTIHLCPECAKMYSDMLSKFLNTKKG